MDELTLKDWTSAYLKYKDSIHKKIEKIEETETGLKVTKKTGETETYLCVNKLEEIQPETITTQKITALNTKKNVDWLIKNWEKLKDTKTTMIFVNTNKAEHWAINPAMHHSITDKSALKPGIQTLFNSISEM